jgi:hypothetical protein
MQKPVVCVCEGILIITGSKADLNEVMKTPGECPWKEKNSFNY